MTFPNYRLPEAIERRPKGGPQWDTTVQPSISGKEQRIKNRANARWSWDIAYGVMNSTDPTGTFRAVYAHFNAHNGKYVPFRFKDWSEYQATNELFFTGDGATLTAQLTKTYDPSMILLGVAGPYQYVREVFLRAVGVTFTLKIDNVVKVEGVDYAVSDTGLVTFASAPANGKLCKWTGEFDMAVRYDVDKLEVVMESGRVASIGATPIIELIGSEEIV
jgi:uncharacterized protein (TIGR02217 family)